MSDDRDRKLQRAARRVQKDKGIKYTHALRLVKEAFVLSDFSKINALPNVESPRE